ncbi:Alcohol dehydrogenase, class IV [Shimia gijangensis]|uniref:Alcohol dehydrogenase 2 n=1 Tax=Shimia gijangensis TaxID=1470563 RepID=A0A1M6D7F4_9RHOB|nr:iron-containing alcohol dehydrogenase [Shimia gijangensis]SHI69071.1 Alcohol dehydrogenase, class IV [Shimia gijangensis]
MSYLDAQDWGFPIPIAYGPGRLKEIASFCSASGMTRPFVVTDRGSAGLSFLQDLIGYLSTAGMQAALYSNISPNPRDVEIYQGRDRYQEGGYDGIIAIGGGSGMDGGKAIALLATNELDLWDFEFGQIPPDMANHPDFPPLICIPTTAGTGAETASTAMVTDTDKHMKWCVWHAKLEPSFAILDPEITVGLPATLTAWTGVDAMVHAIEAYCVPGTNPLCDALALEGLRLINRWLPTAVKDPGNIEARGAMLAGTCLAGVAFQKGLGLVHAISHMVGAEYDTQHGLTNAILLPAALRFNAPEIADKVKPMAQAMDLSETSFQAFFIKVCDILDDVEIPRTLTDIGVPDDGIKRISEKALKDSAAATNPRSLSVSDIEAVLKEALTVGR